MKRLWFIAILAASASACVEGNNAVQVVSVVPQGEQCSPEEIPLSHGRLNYDASDEYKVVFRLFSPVVTDETGATSTPVAFYAQEIVYNYESKIPPITFIEESKPIFFAVEAGAQPGEAWIEVDLIGSEARKKLNGPVPPHPDVLTLLATVKIKGELPSGKAVETNEITFPIDISRAEACSEGQEAKVLNTTGEPLGPCVYAGQDKYFSKATFTCVPSGG